MIKIQILKNNKPFKVKKKKLKQPVLVDMDFSSIHQLVGNKSILEYCFQLTKNECLNG
jgi:hypothetical protein